MIKKLMFVISVLVILVIGITSAYSYPTVEQSKDSFLLEPYEDDDSGFTSVNLSDYLSNTSESGNYSYEITLYDDGSNSTSSWSDTLNRDDPDGVLCNDESPINVSNQQIKVCSDTVYNPDTDQDDAEIYFKSKDENYNGVVEVEILDDEGSGTGETMYFNIFTDEQGEYSESIGFGNKSNVLPYTTNIENNEQELLGYFNFADDNLTELLKKNKDYDIGNFPLEYTRHDSFYNGNLSVSDDMIGEFGYNIEDYQQDLGDKGYNFNYLLKIDKNNLNSTKIQHATNREEQYLEINGIYDEGDKYSMEVKSVDTTEMSPRYSNNRTIDKYYTTQINDKVIIPVTTNIREIPSVNQNLGENYSVVDVYMGGTPVFSEVVESDMENPTIYENEDYFLEFMSPSIDSGDGESYLGEFSFYTGAFTHTSWHKNLVESQKRLGYTETDNNITDKIMSEERETYDISQGFNDVGFIRYEIQKDGQVIDTIRTGYTKTLTSNLDSLDTGDVEFTADFTGESYGDQQYNLEVDNYDNVDETYTINATAYDYWELEPTASQTFTVDTNSTSTQYPPEKVSDISDLNMNYEETKSKDIGDIFEDYDELYVSSDVDDTIYNISSTDSTKSDSMTSDVFDMEFISSDVIEVTSKTSNYNDNIKLTACNDDGCSSTDFTLDISEDVGSPEFTENLQDISAKGYDKNNQINISEVATNYDKVEVEFRDDLNQINNYLTVVNSIDTDSYESERFGEVRLSRTVNDDFLLFTSHNRDHNTPVNITIVNSNTGEQASQEVYLNSSSYDYDDDIKESHKQLVEEPYLLDFRDYMDDKKQESVESVNLSYYVDDSIQSLYVDEVEQESYGSIQDNTTLSMWVEKENVFGDIVWGVGSNVFDYKGWGVDFKPVQLNIKYNDSEYDNENITIDYYVNESSYEDSGGTGGENDSDDDVQEPDDMDTEAPDWFPEPPEDQQLWWAMIVLLGVVGATTLMTPADSFFARASFGVVAGVGVFVLLTAVGWIPLGYLIAFLLIVSLIIGYMFSRLIIGTG